MRLFSGIADLPGKIPTTGAALAVAAVIALAGCENTGTGGGRNSPDAGPLTGANAPTRVESPLPGEPGASPPRMTTGPAIPTQPGMTGDGPMSGIQLTPPPGMANRTRVALLLPLSGSRADLGQAVLDAAKLALFDVADGNFELRPYDTGATGEGAASAAERAVADGVKLVIGPIFSAAVQGATPIIQNAGLNMLAFSNNRDVAEPGVYLSGLFPETQIERVIAYAARRGARRLGVLAPRGSFGVRVLQAAQRAAAASGVELVRSQEFGPSTDDIVRAARTIGDYDVRRAALLAQKKALTGREDEVSKRALARLEILDTLGPVAFDALLVATSEGELVNMAAQLGNFDIDTKRVRLLGLSSWASDGTGREPALVGGWFAAPPATDDNDFTRNFRAMYETAPHPLAANAYDLVALAAILGSQEGGARYDSATLTSETGFAGISGLFRFLPSGLSERSLEVREITPTGNKIVDPAQKSFEMLTN
ncbi:MAG: branched-chain amino acid transport system substrate-binding protein [Paracoccaceae bacterium]|jgi:branched-chain amino acid transport system substrate-binding protein